MHRGDESCLPPEVRPLQHDGKSGFVLSQRIALGFGNNVDLEIAWDAETINNLVADYAIVAADLAGERVITNERELLISILRFVQAGRGGERFVANSGLIEHFGSRFQRKISLGGSPPRAAIAMGKLGHTAALHLVSINDEIRQLLPAACPWVCSNPRDSHYPHLIVQYARGATIQANDIHIVAPAANRLIYHCNADNITMRLNADFADLLTNARALLVSGFNAMQSADLLIARLENLSEMLQKLPAEAVLFCEDGGYFDAKFRRILQTRLVSRLDVYSMNEDELAEQLGARIPLDDAQAILPALDWLQGRIPAKTLVLHTNRWALAHGGGAKRYDSALRAGVTVATTRYCHGDDWTLVDYQAMQARPPSPANAHFAEAIHASRDDTCCVPVATVAPTYPTTIGLGDAFVGGFMTALAD
ncbi:MAG: hypothetical protein F4Y70_05790 [Chloroflexi bacterium]|nr:hypothetical protein [Chloroflexota bacterium]